VIRIVESDGWIRCYYDDTNGHSYLLWYYSKQYGILGYAE